MKALVLAAALLAPPALAADAARVWEARCADCHGKDGRGRTGMGRRLGVKDLTATAKSVPELAADIADGIPERKMPAYGKKLTAEQIEALAAYVKELKR
ncbi:MAG TPA: cytochrome c [Anaeromyxobacteraceae bacterium]|nr:cytochrome c [Anaeromyxobacteraceae bacterium]